MPRGDKSAYTAKQRRQAEHIEEGYKRRGVPEEEAERRAWATENAMTGGGRKSGSGPGSGVEAEGGTLGVRAEGRGDAEAPRELGRQAVVAEHRPAQHVAEAFPQPVGPGVVREAHNAAALAGAA